MSELRRVAEHHVAEDERLLSGYFHDRDSPVPVARHDLLERMRSGLVTMLDAGPRTNSPLCICRER